MHTTNSSVWHIIGSALGKWEVRARCIGGGVYASCYTHTCSAPEWWKGRGLEERARGKVLWGERD